MNSLIIIGIMMLAGLVLSRAAKLVKLPNVTAFLVAGLLIGPCVGGVVSKANAASLGIVSEAALGFIAYSIGGEFRLSYLKEIGKAPLTITLCQGLSTALCVDAGLILFGVDTPLSLILGAIALATAPAATLMVVRQYKADGPVTRMLLPVVAMDDALGLIVFSVSASVAEGMLGGQISVKSMLLTPLIEIFGSIALGAVLGIILAYGARFFQSRGNRLALSIALVFLGVGLCDLLGLSSLLVCMMIGAMMVNMSQQRDVLMEQCDRFTPPLFLLFFVLSGAQLDLGVLPQVGLIGVAYLLLRSLGKWGGTFLGAVSVKADKHIRHYLGLTLLPQAGVAIGMASLVSARFPSLASQVNTIVLAGVLVFELVGPVITKIALRKAGEIPEGK
ncbi:MAG: cation:proton antiporter [Clostridia bacterium]|nr:cation:proton antiporter [Clostridia bacterium]MCR4577367.1 cation:proton antiporter [Clostridiales bacterium]